MIGVIDVETSRIKSGERPRTKFWGVALDLPNAPRYERFATTKHLWKYLEGIRTPLTLYHHHDYDALQALMDGAPIKIVDVVGGKILRSIGPCKHEWRNSLKLFDSPLHEILTACGYKKPPLEADGHPEDCPCHLCDEALEIRNRIDTLGALDSFKQLSAKFESVWGVYPLGSKFKTAASVSFAAAVKVAGPLPQWLENREAYRGGRVEAFRVGHCGQADQWDINSSYPFAFLDLPRTDKLYYANVDIRGDNGPAPFAHVTDDSGDARTKLLFPSGRFSTAFWASNYERYIKAHGRIKGMEVTQTLKADFGWLHELHGLIQGAYDCRQRVKKTDPALAYACKLGLNAIYGRLGMKDQRQVPIYSDRVASGGDVVAFDFGPTRPAKERILSFVDIHTEPSANYLFAGAITDNARGRLYDAMRRAGDTFYCDTDSVYLAAGKPFPSRQGGDLGAWKFEGSRNLHVTGLKDYLWGYPESGIGPVYKTTLKGGDGYFEWTLKKALGRGTVKQVKKSRSSEYDKREILPSGNTVPKELCDW